MLSSAASVALLATLRGEAPSATPGAEQGARARHGEASGGQALADPDEATRGVQAATAALAREHALVTLPDGTSLSIDDAERRLCAKEERGPHRALRRSVEHALDSSRWFDDRRIEDSSLDAAAAAFLAGTGELAFAAVEALEAVGGASIEDAAALAWALDLPSAGFQLPVATAVLSAARAAAGTALPCLRVPRALAGVVLEVERVKLGVAGSVGRADRWSRILSGGLEVLAHGRATSTSVGRAFALGAMSPAVLRPAGLSRDEAERVCRIGAARALLVARGRVALGTVGWPEALEVVTRRSIRPTAAVRELLAPMPGEAPAVGVVSAIECAAAAIAAQAAWDEAFVLDARAWRDARSSPKTSAPEAWRAWVGPWL